MRKIIHIDMDAFYASIEQRDYPQLRNKPIVVGYSGKRGVVAAASYEARKYGIRSAMPSQTAKYKYPQLVFMPPRFHVYAEVSKQIRSIFLEYTDLVEPLSLDEAYLDVTNNRKGIISATIIAQEIKKRIKKDTGLTASAGVSINKFLAKIASDYNKPDGLFVVTEKEAEAFVASLRIEQFWGIGPVTAKKMHNLGIHTGNDLKKKTKEELIQEFGKAGYIYYQNARAIDNRLVVVENFPKSIGVENTFQEDLSSREQLSSALHDIAEELWQRISKGEYFGRTITLKIKYNDFVKITRSRTLSGYINEFDTLWQVASDLLIHIDRSKPIRLMGLAIGNIYNNGESIQLELDF
ncbi:DNA polymerase IV [Bacteroidales bacterium OttesenSCG-928-M11]|nr:DNA polymerase IV [Bacteroidales bacterium OttesenSCG-928-M11]